MEHRPEWLKVRAPTAAEAHGMRQVRDLLGRHRLRTVCQGAVCPNAVECWGARTATFMILGNLCTRSCRYCGVPSGDPGGALDRDEPRRLAAAVAELGLQYVVITSVDRDDLPHGGSTVFAEAVRRIKAMGNGITVEVLVPDFSGDSSALDRVLNSGADVLGHNLETVERLSPALRDRRAGYGQSLGVLAHLRRGAGKRTLKSGLMLGLGEKRDEIFGALADLRDAGVGIVTLGQYLRPTVDAVPVARYIRPEEFDDIAEEARVMGFAAVVAGPLVRSSYHAARAYVESCGS